MFLGSQHVDNQFPLGINYFPIEFTMKWKLHLSPNEMPVAETETVPRSDVEKIDIDSKGQPDATNEIPLDTIEKPKEEVITKEFQHGVQSAQAVIQIWSTKHLILAYILSAQNYS